MIELDITLWFQLANFLVTLVVLNYLLVSPVRNILRQRKEKTVGLVGDIEAFAEQSRKMLDEYEAELARVRAEASARRKQAKAEAEVEERALLSTASKEAHSRLQASQAAVRAEFSSAREALQADMKSFTDAALAKVLG
ncbi:MAG: ATP synthase F0 subunit B [Bilophila sp.]